MAFDKVIDSVQLENDLRGVADSIRAKAGTTEALTFPEGFKNAVDNIPTGGGDLSEIEQMIDESGVLDSTEGTVEEKVEKIIDYADLMTRTKAVSFVGDTEIESIDLLLDVSGISTLSNCFRDTTNLKTIKGFKDTSHITTAPTAFHSSGIVSIEEPFNLSSITTGQINICVSAFYLEEVRFVEECIKKAITFWGDSKLSAESIQSIAYGLAYVTTALTLTLPTVFENDFERLPAELRDLINAKGWTLVFA